jgi:RNA polymerase sigma factor (sigma-70 family)
MHIEEALIHSCKKNDAKAQKRLYMLLLPYLRAIVNRYLRDTSFEKDALQESFVKIFKTIDSFNQQKGELKSWAGRITINTCLNLNKRLIGQAMEAFESLEYVQPTESKDYATDRKGVLFKLLKDMPPDYSAVFNLFVIDGYDHQEIAEILSISPALSRKRLSRARVWLRWTEQRLNPSKMAKKK